MSLQTFYKSIDYGRHHRRQANCFICIC